MENVLVEGRTCWRRGELSRARVLVDARAYYAAFCRAALLAERTLLLSGWQFDTKVRLLRGEDAARAPHPVELVGFLTWLCERNPPLEIYILAWDFSSVYAIEREWLQRLKFAFRSHERVHLEYWTHPDPGGSHHQKYVVVDESVAFLGGIDICDARWDDRRHRPDEPERVDVSGDPCKPYHDVQAVFSGPLVRDLRELFVESWARASGERLSLPQVPNEGAVDPWRDEGWDSGLPLRAGSAVLSRTDFRGENATVREVNALLEAAILAAERLVYIETQYFTSRSVLAAFRRRMEDPLRSKLVIVIVMPDGGDTPKEDFVLGERQRAVRFALSQLAARHGHQLRILISRDDADPEHPVHTFIHSKLLVVDDELLTVGSANLSNRSMEVDMELNVSFQGDPGSSLCQDIGRVRASLLAEHAGGPDEGAFEAVKTLVDRIDQASRDPRSKLRCLELVPPEDDDPFLVSVFDPSGSTTLDSMERCLERRLDVGDGVLKRALRKVGQRLGVIDID